MSPSAQPPKIGFNSGQGIDRQAFHGVRRRRINSSCVIGLLLPDRKAASRTSRIFLWLSGTGISFSSATESQRRSAISRRFRLGSRRRDETVRDGMPEIVGKRVIRARSGFVSNVTAEPRLRLARQPITSQHGPSKNEQH